MIEAKNITKRFEEDEKTLEVLKDVSFSVDEGEFLSIVGLSGSGKTTLLRILAGIDTQYDGEILIKNTPLKKYLKTKSIAVVGQKYSTFPWMSVQKNIEQANPNAPRKKIEELLKRLGLFNFRNYFPGQLSGGMQQRVAIARALLQDSEVILFDEPFGALDTQTRRQIHGLILSLWEEEKKTFIFITHSIDEALFLSKKVIVLGSHPGIIRSAHTVPFSYPRNIDLYFSNEFIKLKKSITYRIRAESITSSIAGVENNFGEMNIGVFTWIGSSPWYYAFDQNMFHSQKVDISLSSYDSHIILLEDLLRGDIDAANLTLDLAMRVAENDPRFLILPPYVLSHGADALVASDKIKDITELKGKTIGVERRGIGHFFVSYLLLESGMSQDDVEIKDILAHDAGAQLINGDIDAAVLWDPWLSEILNLDSLKVVESSASHNVLLDALLVKKSFFNKHKEAFSKITSVWQQAVKKIQDTSESFIVASYLGMSDHELHKSLNSLKFLTKETEDTEEARPIISRHFQKEVQSAKKTQDPISKDVMNWSTDFHLTLLQDTNRMDAYNQAIFEGVKPGDTVLDLGTGTGVLARWAIDAGAQHVFAIEGNKFIASMAEESFSAEPYASKITLIKDYSPNVNLTEKVDVIISEIIGNIADNEGMIPILNDARKRFLKKDGRMIPQKVTSYIVPVFAPELDRLKPTAEESSFGYRDAFIDNSFHISEASELKSFLFDSRDSDEYEVNLSFTCSTDTKFHGFKAYFSAQLLENVSFEIRTLDDIKDNKEGSWRHAFLPINKTFEIKERDVIKVRLKAHLTNPKTFTKKYTFSGVVIRKKREVFSFTSLSK
jgi:ABC-type nitrate/sulfonate/bicarbonate transport system ATPase subunit/ABC-type nitrate/sulfonate/bicarbonate transport system substrate-binding protein/ubiquinone/menaquinone biosynthesis C-methylase UbiE